MACLERRVRFLPKTYGAVIIAVTTMGEVQVPQNHIVNVIAVRDGLMTATCAMAMAGVMTAAGMRRSAKCGILGGDGEYMLVDVVTVVVVQVAVVQVIGVAFMRHHLVAAPGSMLVTMIVMHRMGRHRRAFR